MFARRLFGTRNNFSISLSPYVASDLIPPRHTAPLVLGPSPGQTGEEFSILTEVEVRRQQVTRQFGWCVDAFAFEWPWPLRALKEIHSQRVGPEDPCSGKVSKGRSPRWGSLSPA